MRRRAVSLVALSTVAVFLSGCLGLSHGHVFQVSIVNDSPQAVVVRDCDSFCSSSAITIDLQPGASTVINRIADDHKLFSITGASGAHIGCLDLYFAEPEQGASVDVSAAGPCPGSSLRSPWRIPALIAAAVIAILLPFVFMLGRRKLG